MPHIFQGDYSTAQHRYSENHYEDQLVRGNGIASLFTESRPESVWSEERGARSEERGARSEAV